MPWRRVWRALGRVGARPKWEACRAWPLKGRTYRKTCVWREWLKSFRTLTCRIRPKKDWQTRQERGRESITRWPNVDSLDAGAARLGFAVTGAPDWLCLAVSSSIHLPPTDPHPLQIFVSLSKCPNRWKCLRGPASGFRANPTASWKPTWD